MKPNDIVGRDAEWAALDQFAAAASPAGGVGLLYGRRRTGKSYLLRRLAASHGGLYFQATETERSDSLAEFGDAVAGTEPIRYASWDDALSRRTGLVIIDEFPYLLRHSPELPSLLQRIVDEANNGERPNVRFMLCGSSLSVMASLLRGQEPLRGRASLDLFLRPMDHRSAATLWRADNHELAVRIDAIFGGAPGYRSLTESLPNSVDDLGRWLGSNVMNPTHALYREDDYLLQEERTITDRALYGSLLRAIAAGVATQSEMAGRLGRSRESLTHPLATLIKAGFVRKRDDVLSGGRPEHQLADPIIRFLRLVVEPARALLDERRWSEVWQRTEPRMAANIYGPHLETIARRWATLDYRPMNDGFVTTVGSAKVNDPTHRRSIDLDVVALGEPCGGKPSVSLIAEVKWSASGFGPDPIGRLERARNLLAATGRNVDQCELALISREPPTVSGNALAIDLAELYGG